MKRRFYFTITLNNFSSGSPDPGTGASTLTNCILVIDNLLCNKLACINIRNYHLIIRLLKHFWNEKANFHKNVELTVTLTVGCSRKMSGSWTISIIPPLLGSNNLSRSRNSSICPPFLEEGKNWNLLLIFLPRCWGNWAQT